MERIKSIIQEVKPGYMLYGGDVEFREVKDEKVRVRPVGYCYR
jgi:Fe-S cluster biogenesis protein NfuA